MLTEMDITLQTNNDSQRLELRGVRRTGQDYSCLLVVESRGFGAARSFYFDEHHLEAFLKGLDVMESALEGGAILRHSFEEDRISFEVSRDGHVTVSGLLVEHSGCTQRLEFCIQTDQTVLKPLLQGFRRLKSGSEGGA